jgi:hypothetical protein
MSAPNDATSQRSGTYQIDPPWTWKFPGNQPGQKEAAGYLAALHTELGKHGLESELITWAIWPRLRLHACVTHNDRAGWEDHIIARQTDDGDWWYYYPWIEKIGPVTDLADTTQLLIDTFTSQGDEEEDWPDAACG